MRRLLSSLLTVAAVAALPSAAQADHRQDTLRQATPADLSGVRGPARLPNPFWKQKVPKELREWARGGVRAADHWTGDPVREERFEDQHGHVYTFATDNPELDMLPWANLLARTYHYREIEGVHVFVTSSERLTAICGGDAAACYAGDGSARQGGGVMIVSYEDSPEQAAHAVIHEYGHHIDNNTYNLGQLTDCGDDGDGSRRWFFARQMQDNILDALSCDPEPGWGQLLAEVFAEDYAQMVGIPREQYHPAIQVRPPTERQKRAIKQDLDKPFAPTSQPVKGRAGRSGVATFRLSLKVPVFLRYRSARGVRGVALRGCGVRNVTGVYAGTCRLIVRAKRPGQAFRFRLILY